MVSFVTTCLFFVIPLQVDDYTVRSPAPLGRVLLVRLEKQKYWVEDNWYCRYVLVTPTEGGTTQTFPCNCWLVGDIKVEVREGTGQSYRFLSRHNLSENVQLGRASHRSHTRGRSRTVQNE